MTDSHQPVVQEPTWPLRGYAPGDYMCRCVTCGNGFTGDKRAIRCLPCAQKAPITRTSDEAARQVGEALEQAHPWGYRSEDNEP